MTKRDMQASEYASEELRDGAVVGCETVLLTDEEREAVEWYANFPDGIHAATLRKLLERLK